MNEAENAIVSAPEVLPAEKAPRGRPAAPIEMAYLQKLWQCVPVEEFERIVRSIVKSAVAGDLKAARLLFDRLLPAQAPMPRDVGNAMPQINILQISQEELAKAKKVLQSKLAK